MSDPTNPNTRRWFCSEQAVKVSSSPDEFVIVNSKKMYDNYTVGQSVLYPWALSHMDSPDSLIWVLDECACVLGVIVIYSLGKIAIEQSEKALMALRPIGKAY